MTRVQRTDATDAVTRDSEAAVLLGERLIRLSALSAAVYDLTEHPMTLEHLAAELESRFGAPAEGSTLDATKEAVTDLVRHGLVRQA